MRVLDTFYWIVEIGCFVLAGLYLLMMLNMLWWDWSLVRSIPDVDRTMSDTHYVISPIARFVQMLPGLAVPLGVGGILHWLRRRAQLQPEAA